MSSAEYKRGVADGLKVAAELLEREAAETEEQFGSSSRGGLAAAVMVDCARLVREAAATRRSGRRATGS